MARKKWKWIVFFIGLALSGFFGPGLLYYTRFLFSSGSQVADSFKIIGHRGSNVGLPENSLEAIQAGAEHQSDFIEIDVRRTKDNVLVIMHDQTVDRTSDGKGSVGDFTWEELQKLQLESEGSRPVRIPTFDQVLDYMKKTGLPLVVEIKDPELYPGIVDQAIRSIKKAELDARVVLMSFDKDEMERAKKNHPGLAVGVFCVGYEDPASFHGLDYVCPSALALFLPGNFAGKAHEAGLLSFVWTIDGVHLMQYSAFCGMDGVITNRPDLAAGLFKEGRK